MIADELGAESDQAHLVLELYAANAVDAACHGIQLPPLDPTLGVALPSNSAMSSSGDQLGLAQIFDQANILDVCFSPAIRGLVMSLWR